MSTTTTTYGFIKPEKTDPADITSTNENWEKIDKELVERTKDLSMGGHKITDVAEPISGSDVATRHFVEQHSIEGNTYVAVDYNKDGNITLKPYVADEDELTFKSHIANKNNPHNVTAEQLGIMTPLGDEGGYAKIGKLLIQWGRVNVTEVTQNVAKEFEIPFFTPFTYYDYSLSLTPVTSTPNLVTASIYSRSADKCSAYLHSAGASSVVGFVWIAIGNVN